MAFKWKKQSEEISEDVILFEEDLQEENLQEESLREESLQEDLTEENLTEENLPEETEVPEGLEILDMEDLEAEAAAPAAPKSHGRRRRGNGRGVLAVQIIIGLLIVVMLGFAAYRLVIWNRGTDVVLDPDEDPTIYETEALDYVQPLDPDIAAGLVDDGVTTILFLGNDPLEDGDEGTRIADFVAHKSGAVVYNCAFKNSNISLQNEEYDWNAPMDAFSLYMIMASKCSGDYTLAEYALEQLESSRASCESGLESLQRADLDKVDIIVYFYGANDYKNKRPVMDVNNDINLLTWNGALNASLRMIKEQHPGIRQVVLSPYYGYYTDADGTVVDMDTTDFGNGVLPDYVLNEIDVAMANGVSILDNYYGTVNETMQDSYLEDGMHLSEAGREAIAEHFVQEILGIGKK